MYHLLMHFTVVMCVCVCKTAYLVVFDVASDCSSSMWRLSHYASMNACALPSPWQYSAEWFSSIDRAALLVVVARLYHLVAHTVAGADDGCDVSIVFAVFVAAPLIRLAFAAFWCPG